jgi:predicted AAA+ superfamily ATPase
MIDRHIEKRVLEDLTFFPAVGIVGPRQVGKTTFAKTLQSKLSKPTHYLDLENAADYAKLSDAASYLGNYQNHCVIIDEIQLMPRLFSQLRSLIDNHRVPARFILLGSVSPTILRDSSESLAGRIAYTELTPFSFLEVQTQTDLHTHWLRGGFPDAIFAPSSSLQQRWIQNFVQTYIQRDLRNLGYEIPQNTLQNLLRMLAQINGNILNMSDLARSLGVSQPTVGRYLDILEGSYLIMRLKPYFVNVTKRLVKAPKIIVRDSGILHYLANIANYEALLGNMIVGGSWESYVIEQINRCMPDSCQLFYYRTHAGAEIDLLIVSPKGLKIGIEIKLSNAPTISKGFYECRQDLNTDFNYVIIPKGERYAKNDAVWVIDLFQFLETELPKLTN